MAHKKFAVILSGCGVYDGAEINEVVLTLLALEHHGIQYQCFAPDIEQHHVINHIAGKEMVEKRNVLTESARIVRGNVKPITECKPEDFSALVIPGGFGAAKNLSNFAFAGSDLTIDQSVFDVLVGFKNVRKPAGYMCIAPVMLPLVYGKGIKLTIGNDKETIAVVEAIGGAHEVAAVDGIVVDKDWNVVTTPAYMLASNIAEAKLGIDKLVEQLDKMS